MFWGMCSHLEGFRFADRKDCPQCCLSGHAWQWTSSPTSGGIFLLSCSLCSRPGRLSTTMPPGRAQPPLIFDATKTLFLLHSSQFAASKYKRKLGLSQCADTLCLCVGLMITHAQVADYPPQNCAMMTCPRQAHCKLPEAGLTVLSWFIHVHACKGLPFPAICTGSCCSNPTPSHGSSMHRLQELEQTSTCPYLQDFRTGNAV